MRRVVFVISDLHLGGEPARDGLPGFQMCGESTHRTLAEFIRWIPSQCPTSGQVQLVLAGDVVDFLAEEKFSPFSEESAAHEKLERILRRTAIVWEALAVAAQRGVGVTLMLGNHDIELSLPRVRRLLMDTLRPGSFEFLYDNQAFVTGPLLVEHGNRYDAWNVVPHNQLRQVRSALSRGEAAPTFRSPAGSLLVANVMNRLKREYAFIDLLKPETAALLPLLALLRPNVVDALGDAVRAYKRSREVSFDRDGTPTDPDNVSVPRAGDPSGTDEMLRLARQLAIDGDPDDAGSLRTLGGFIDIFRASVQSDRRKQIHRLRRALLALKDFSDATFDTTVESDTYRKPALRLAERGFGAVVFGHTHLAKRVDLPGGARYLNSGTWADLMRVPPEVYDADEDAAAEALDRFAADLANNDTTRYRRQLPSFVRVELDGSNLVSADVYAFGRDAQTSIVPRHILES